MLGVIGGSGLYSLESLGGFRIVGQQTDETRWGRPSSVVTVAADGEDGTKLAFLARHGDDHSIAAHLVNYRANIEALRSAGVTRLLAVASVGGIGPDCLPGTLVVPDQLIDYTWGREQTFAGVGDPVVHTDFTNPYTPAWRTRVIASLHGLDEPATVVESGTYAAVQGPRFESAAEVSRLARDGCTVVGMTGMPEAILAREAGLEYAAVCPVGNLAAGISPEELTMAEVVATVAPAGPLLAALIATLA